MNFASQDNGESHNSSRANPFTDAVTCTVAVADQEFDPPIKGFILTASGDVQIQFKGGSIQTIPYIVAADDSREVRSYEIIKMFKDGTDATVLCGLR